MKFVRVNNPNYLVQEHPMDAGYPSYAWNRICKCNHCGKFLANRHFLKVHNNNTGIVYTSCIHCGARLSIE